MYNHTLLLKELTTASKDAKELRKIHRAVVEELIKSHATKLQKELILQKKPSGKPYFLDTDENVSISHSGDWVAILFCKKAHPGIDVQRVEERIQKLSHKFVHPKEKNYVQNSHFSLSLNQILTLIWCVKESVYKAFSDQKLLFSEEIYVQQIIEDQAKVLVQIVRPRFENIIFVDYFIKEDYVFAYCFNENLNI